MTEKLYEPLPDIDAYLDRIGIDRERKGEEPSAAFLDELILAHQCTVPFENLDVYERHAAPSLGIAELFQKIVVRKRGGYCFELNALFNALLLALGFKAHPCMARVTFRPNPHPVLSHRCAIVTIDGSRYLADVGFGGPMPSFAPLMENGASRTERGQTFTMHQVGDLWWEVGFTGNSEVDQRVLRVCALPVEEHDFIPLSFFQSQNPESTFRLNRMVNIRTEDGALNVRNSTFTEFRQNGRHEEEIDEAEFDSLLREKFGIVR